MGTAKLLTHQSSNAKLAKNADVTSQWETSILYLVPSNIAGLFNADGTPVNLCPAATAGCRAACLFTAGRGAMTSTFRGRLRKTKLYVEQRAEFNAQLVRELTALVKRQLRTGVRQAVRLNGTSDIAWERHSIIRDGIEFAGVPQAFPELQFYDYTKLALRDLSDTPNYRLTYSRSEVNDRVMARYANLGHNIAVVFAGPELPTEFYGRPVIDGTTHDMRFLDPAGVIVGLLPKGKARKDTSGFVVSTPCSNKQVA